MSYKGHPYIYDMKTQAELQQVAFPDRVRHSALNKWESLTDQQRTYAKKAWGVITYKWRWQIAMNIPYLAIFLLDRTVPAVHQFDMALLANVSSKIPLPTFISSFLGLG